MAGLGFASEVNFWVSLGNWSFTFISLTRLEESKTMEAEERARLEEEINSKRSEVITIKLAVHFENILDIPIQVEDILTEVQRKEEENRQLQEEMDAARQR